MEENVKKDKNPHQGHRQKARERYYKGGLDCMPDHNVLEMLLFFGIPYKDTNEIAHSLIEKFGSFSGVLKADRTDLQNVKGMTENAACLISMLLPVFKRYTDDLMKEKPTLETTEQIVNFIKPRFIDTTNEKVYLICFDCNHALISVRFIDEGDIASANINLRKIASTVIETKAASVILVHNHPNSISLPSQADIGATKKAYELLSMLKVRLLDHIIISQTGHCSMVSVPKFAHIFYGLDPIFDEDE
ncbi:MAG: RadC family protein [Acutalibacteraceae bacterium]